MGEQRDDIEVGANADDGTLRFWLAEEALRQSELRLSSQMTILNVVTGRASAILGWSVTILLALTAALASLGSPASGAGVAATLHGTLFAPALVAAAGMLASGSCCIRVLWPGRWYTVGHDPAWLLAEPYDTELEVRETLATGYATGAALNAESLETIDYWLRAAWLFFLGSPTIAALIYLSVRNTGHHA